MPTNDRGNEHDELIEYLKALAAAAIGGRMVACESAGLARLRVVLEQTDHLSDRELCTQLLRELLPEEMPALDVDKSAAWHINVLGYDKPELYLKYYADEKTRESWRTDFPDDPIPAREDPPHGRDHYCGTVSSRGDRTVHRQCPYGKDCRQPTRGFISRLVSATTGKPGATKRTIDGQ